jgi:hypothetical protein
MKRWELLLLLAVGACACTGRVANTCPGADVPRCLTELVCVTDDARGCQVCRCAAPGYVPLNAQRAKDGSELPAH